MRTRVLRHPLRSGIDPSRAHDALIGDRRESVWLDGGPDGVSYLALGRPVALGDPVLPSIRSALAALAPGGIERDDGLPDGFVGGLVGWLGYEARGETTGAEVRRPGRRAAFLAVDRMLVIDPGAGSAELRALGTGWTGELLDWRDRVEGDLERAPEPAPWRAPAPVLGRWRVSDARYLEHIARCRAAIREGDAYQLCLTNEFVVAGKGMRDGAVALHRRLRATSPTHHGGLLRIGESDLVSASPERFLRVRPDGVVESSPIKGTRPRAIDPAADAAARAELAANEKERAENVMIVDLVRNDLSRVCDPAGVEVVRLLEVESYAQVHQLVSTVRGRLRPGLGPVDAVEALFPAGSMTGAPKRRATELLDAIEDRARGAYAGAFGWLGVDGAADLAMTIRSIVVDDRGATIGAGGGITALSEPAAELEEVRIKAAPLLAALGASEAPDAHAGADAGGSGNGGDPSGVGYPGARPSAR